MKILHRNQRGNLSEMPVAMIVFFLFIVFPFLNLVFYAAAVATVAFITTQCASAAAAAPDYDSALAAMQTTCNNLSNSAWGAFARLKPVGGYLGSGADLYVVKVPTANPSAIVVSKADQPDASAIDPTTYVYEYRVRTNYNIAPFTNLAGLPFIGQVPLIGQAVNLSFCSERNVEMVANLGPTSVPAGTGSGGAGSAIVTQHYFRAPGFQESSTMKPAIPSR